MKGRDKESSQHSRESVLHNQCSNHVLAWKKVENPPLTGSLAFSSCIQFEYLSWPGWGWWWPFLGVSFHSFKHLDGPPLVFKWRGWGGSRCGAPWQSRQGSRILCYCIALSTDSRLGRSVLVPQLLKEPEWPRGWPAHPLPARYSPHRLHPTTKRKWRLPELPRTISEVSTKDSNDQGTYFYLYPSIIHKHKTDWYVTAHLNLAI